jgi:acetyl-CoA C-acetyltransferase
MTHATNLIGWSHTVFGKLDAPDVETLMGEVALAALADADVAPKDVDAIFVGVYNNGFSKQSFDAALVGSACPELAYVPATRMENACATGSAALYAACDFVESGRGRVALVIGAEKMTRASGAEVNDILLGASHQRTEAEFGSFAAIFGELARGYGARYGDQSDTLAAIAAKNHRYGVDNPYAHLRKDLGLEFCSQVSEKNPLVAGPLRRTDCSLVSDGAAALVVADAATSRHRLRSIGIRSRSHANSPFAVAARRDPLFFDGAATAFRGALESAGLTLADLDLLETHDCFTQAELMQYEAFGLAEPGHGHRVVEEGVTARDGALPTNVSGGLKSKGHPIGATGVSQHVMAAMQLSGEAGAMQLDHPARAAVFNMGGAAVANYATILEAK